MEGLELDKYCCGGLDLVGFGGKLGWIHRHSPRGGKNVQTKCGGEEARDKLKKH